MNAASSNEEPLDGRLRRSLAPFADDAFSKRVLSALPSTPRQASRVPAKWIFCGVGGMAGVIFFFARAGSWTNAENGFIEATSALSILSDPLVLWAAAATIVSLLLVPLGQDRRL